MINSPINSTDFRLLLPEVIWLNVEHFNQAKELSSNPVKDETHQWQTYLNVLALIGFEQWLSERMPDRTVNRNSQVIEAGCYLKVDEFKFCLIATENLLDEVVNVPRYAIDKLELTAHFYVVLEVLEEQEQVLIRGFWRYDQLVDYRHRFNFQSLQDGYYQLPLSEFDAEPNHLLFYCSCLKPTAISLPVASAEENLLGYLKETRTKLSQWLQSAFNEGWLTIDALINSEANLALSTRNASESAKRGKLIDLGMQLGNQAVALLINISEEAEKKLGVLIQLHPTGGEKYLPPNLKLTLLSKARKILQEVESRTQDNYIQLKYFKGEPGKQFSIEVSLGNVSVREDFEL